jgi:hypothetical protein
MGSLRRKKVHPNPARALALKAVAAARKKEVLSFPHPKNDRFQAPLGSEQSERFPQYRSKNYAGQVSLAQQRFAPRLGPAGRW